MIHMLLASLRSSQRRERPNQAMEVTASGRTVLLSDGLDLYPVAMHPLARVTSSWSR